MNQSIALRGMGGLGNYDTRLSKAIALQNGLVSIQHYNDRQIHSIIALEQQGKCFLKFLAGKAANLGGDYRSIILEVETFDPNYTAAIGKAIAQEQAKFPNSGPLERESSYLAQLITSGKMPLVEARGIEFQDQNWSTISRNRFMTFAATYFYKCQFRNLYAAGTDFSAAHFRNCEFAHIVDFTQAILSCSRFSEQCSFDDTFCAVGADFSGVDFGDTILKGNFSKTNLQGVVADSFRSHVLGYNTTSPITDILLALFSGSYESKHEQIRKEPHWQKTYDQLREPIYHGAKIDHQFYRTLKAIEARSSFHVGWFLLDCLYLTLGVIAFIAVAGAILYFLFRLLFSK